MSKSGQEHWLDRLFKKRLDSFELKPSDEVWDNIARHLDGERRPFLLGNWMNWLWAVIFLAVVGGLVALLWSNRVPVNQGQPKQPMDFPHQNQTTDDKGTAMISVHHKQDNSRTFAPEAIVTKVSYTRETNDQVENKEATSSESRRASVGLVKSETPLVRAEGTIKPVKQGNYSEKVDEIPTEAQTQDAEILLASSDPDFMIAKKEDLRWTETNKIPGLQNYLQTKNRKLDFTKIAEGCNVYSNNKAHFFVDAYYAPELAKRSFSVSDPSVLAYAEKRANTEKPILSYTMGLRGSVVFSNGLAFRTGLQYSNNSERFDYIKETQTIIIERKDKNGNVISLDTQVTEIMDQSYNHFRSFDIPFILGYEKDLKDFILSLNGGLGFNISTKHSGKIYQADQKTIYNLGDPGEGSQLIYKTKAGLSLITSVGLNYKYNERIMLMLEPSARYYFNSITEESYPVKQKYLFFGLNIGLRYRVL